MFDKHVSSIVEHSLFSEFTQIVQLFYVISSFREFGDHKALYNHTVVGHFPLLPNCSKILNVMTFVRGPRATKLIIEILLLLYSEQDFFTALHRRKNPDKIVIVACFLRYTAIDLFLWASANNFMQLKLFKY